MESKKTYDEQWKEKQDWDYRKRMWQAFRSGEVPRSEVTHLWGFSDYEEKRNEGLSHEEACDIVMDNVWDTSQGL